MEIKPEELYDVGHTIMTYALPRLKAFKELRLGYIENAEEYLSKLDAIIEAFELLTRDDGSRIFNEEEKKKVKKGLSYIPEMMEKLWY